MSLQRQEMGRKPRGPGDTKTAITAQNSELRQELTRAEAGNAELKQRLKKLEQAIAALAAKE